ncbi:MAG: YARHG domain-containing protein [Ruminococcaceae bacterium]|nr:YARHG domain-containing protein [Oscillospiraceae bacterium]
MKKFLSILLSGAILISLTGCGLLGNSEISEATKKGMTKLQKGDYQAALEAFDKALNLGAKKEETQDLYEMLDDYLTAKDAYDKGNYQLAEEYLDEMDDDYRDYDTFRQDVRDLEKKIEQAIDDQRQAEAQAQAEAAKSAASSAAQSAAAAEQAAAQAATRANNPPPAPPASNSYGDGYLFPSDREYLTVGYLNTLDKNTIDLIRNEIYARHGYIFQTQKYINYFNAQSWYVPSVPAASFNTSVFNSVEQANLNLLIDYQGL